MPIKIKKSKKPIKQKQKQKQSQNVKQSVVVNLHGIKARGGGKRRSTNASASGIKRIIQEPIYMTAASYPQVEQRQDISSAIKEASSIFNKQLNDTFLNRFHLNEPKAVDFKETIMKGASSPSASLFEFPESYSGGAQVEEVVRNPILQTPIKPKPADKLFENGPMPRKQRTNKDGFPNNDDMRRTINIETGQSIKKLKKKPRRELVNIYSKLFP
jgi:hypothetical protein